MKIKFLKPVRIGGKIYEIGECLKIKEPGDTLMDLNDDFYIIVYRGLRYDVRKDEIEITEV